MTDVVFRHGPHRPGATITGYAPKPGDVRDDKGRLVLVYRYGGGGKSVAAALYADAVEAAGGKVLRADSKRVTRGVVVEQDSLL